MAAPWVEICRLRGGNIIIRSPFYLTGGVKSERLSFFTNLQRKAYQLIYLVVLFHVFWVGRCTGDAIITLKKMEKVRFL